MTSVAVGRILIAVSESEPKNPGDMKLLEPSKVPDWLKDPDILGRMVDGELAHDPERGPQWYAAVRVNDPPANDELAESESSAIHVPGRHLQSVPTIVLPENPQEH